jgi:hypothetical protein
LFYAVLVDLGDAVAEELSLPFDSISLEMIYRGLYHFYVAHQQGKATDPIKYFAAPENQDLSIVKRQRKPNMKLIVAPFPGQYLATIGDTNHYHRPFSKLDYAFGLIARWLRLHCL